VSIELKRKNLVRNGLAHRCDDRARDGTDRAEVLARVVGRARQSVLVVVSHYRHVTLGLVAIDRDFELALYHTFNCLEASVAVAVIG
jgi:hypothetical protein